MRRVALMTLFLAYTGCAALGFYEVTAKSPFLFGAPSPGWIATCKVEQSTPWRPETGILPLDKILHEAQEACLFFGIDGAVRSCVRRAR